MRVHSNQMDTILQIDAAAAAAKADAKKEAENIRRKLRNAAGLSAGEEDSEDCVVRLSGDGSPEDEANQQGSHEQDAQQEEQAGAEGDDTFSHWA